MARLAVRAGVVFCSLTCCMSTDVAANVLTIYEDKPDPTCTVGQSCTPVAVGGQWTGPTVRGLCVIGQQCWDACNTKHLPTAYSQDNSTAKAIALMIKQFRTGMRGIDSCPGATLTPTCNPSERCTHITLMRGMCVTVNGQGNQCLDMCDGKIPVATFNFAGKQKNTVDLVTQVRGGRDPQGYTTCPGMSVWVWLWFPILLCCALGFCALAYWMFNYYRGRLKQGVSASQKFRQPEQQPYVQDDVPYGNYDQVQPQMMPTDDRMPVVDPAVPVMDIDQIPMLDSPKQAEVPLVAPMTAMEPGLFGEPNLMGGLAPATMAAPMTVMPPGYGTPFGTGYPQAGSMALSNPMMGTQMGYGPYGAYGAPGGFPASSMRIG